MESGVDFRASRFVKKASMAWDGLFNAVEKRRGLRTVHASLDYRPLVDKRSRVQWQVRRAEGPLDVAEWLDTGASEVPQRIVSLLRLYGYVLCLEVRYMYAVAGNLFAAYCDERRVAEGNAAYEKQSAVAALKLVTELQTEAKIGYDLVDEWNEIMQPSLRNAIAHSDFILTENVL